MAGDLSNEDFVKQLLDATVNHYGKLDILVCILLSLKANVANKKICFDMNMLISLSR